MTSFWVSMFGVMVAPVTNLSIMNLALESLSQTQVPVCCLATPISQVLPFFAQGWGYVVVVDQRHAPRGLLTLDCCLPLWSDFLSGQQGDGDTNDLLAARLDQLSLHPLPTVDASALVSDLLERINNHNHVTDTWALVDPQGSYVGVINAADVLKVLAQPLVSAVAVGVASEVGSGEQSAGFTAPEKAELARDSLAYLLPLVDQIPLPVLLRRDDGTIVGMNQRWRDDLYLVGATLSQRSLVVSDHSVSEVQQFCVTTANHTWQVTDVALYGEFHGLEMIIAQDITTQRSLVQELSGLSRLKDEFLACINHELKTPLTSVIGIASLLTTNTLGELTPRQRRYVNMIYQSGRHLVNIIDNIVDLAKAESGQLELEPELFNITAICQKSIHQVQKLMQQEALIHRTVGEEDSEVEIEVRLEVDPVAQTIVADGTRLQQMLLHLLSNACKFSTVPPDLISDKPVTKPIVGLSVRHWEGWLAFTVWDQGIGIPEEKQHLVFQKFQQLEHVMTRRFDGTGLGLVLTRHLARLHGGDVTFVSQENVGSQFTILLPPAPPNNNLMAFQVAVAHSRLVLVVESSAQQVEWFVSSLSAWGYRVVVARSGTEAIEKARRLKPCLIMINPSLPMLSGWDVLSLLKCDNTTQGIVMVMVLDAVETPPDHHQADGILRRPLSMADVSFYLPQYVQPKKRLILIYLRQGLPENLAGLFQQWEYRLLEADNVEQAEVLVKIWQPDGFLLSCRVPHLVEMLHTISRHELLSHLPILLVDAYGFDEVEALRQTFAHLDIHPCNDINLPPHLSVAELVNLPQSQIKRQAFQRSLQRSLSHLQAPTILLLHFQPDDILSHSLQHYLLAGGFQVQLCLNHQELPQHLSSGTIDAVLVMLHNQSYLSTAEQQGIKILSEVAHKTPIIVVDGRNDHEWFEESEEADGINQLLYMAVAVLEQPDAIANLVPTLNQCLHNR
ncbi:MAG: ATP-binding protein [Pseudanabaenaceae cyanobacterium]